MSRDTESKPKIVIDRAPWASFLPNIFRRGLLGKVASSIAENPFLRKGHIRGYAELPLHEPKCEYEGGVLVLTHRQKLVLVSLPEEDFGVDSRTDSDTDRFYPTKTEYLEGDETESDLYDIWLGSIALTRDMLSAVSGQIENGDESDPVTAMAREALEEIGIKLVEDRIQEIDIPPFSIIQSTGTSTFRGSLRDLLMGRHPVNIQSVQVSPDATFDEVPFRYGKYRFNVNQCFSYELTNRELHGLQSRMTTQGREVEVLSLNEALKTDLKPSTRKALELIQDSRKK